MSNCSYCGLIMAGRTTQYCSDACCVRAELERQAGSHPSGKCGYCGGQMNQSQVGWCSDSCSLKHIQQREAAISSKLRSHQLEEVDNRRRPGECAFCRTPMDGKSVGWCSVACATQHERVDPAGYAKEVKKDLLINGGKTVLAIAGAALLASQCACKCPDKVLQFQGVHPQGITIRQ